MHLPLLPPSQSRPPRTYNNLNLPKTKKKEEEEIHPSLFLLLSEQSQMAGKWMQAYLAKNKDVISLKGQIIKKGKLRKSIFIFE